MAYIPKVGEECLYSLGDSNTWHKCNIIFIVGTQGVVMESKTAFEGVQFCGMGSVKFKPLKTPAEIEREKSVTKALEVLGYRYSDGSVLKILGDLYDAGMLWNQQVKPLSYDDFADLYVTEGYLPLLYKRLKPYIVQGGE